MYVASLRLKNFKCYRGETILELGPIVYAILASDVNDPRVSNWRGKSSLLEAIRYALTGELPKHIRLEDDWITRGEKVGEVELILSSGDRILRSRHLGKSTRLYWNDKAIQGDAQIEITKAIGLSDDDLLNTCYFEQKNIARLVRADASDRIKVVGDWLDLDPIRMMETRARALLSDVEKELHAKNAHVLSQRAIVDDILAELTLPPGAVLTVSDEEPKTWFDLQVESLSSLLEEAEDARDTAEGTLLSFGALERMAGQVDRYNQLTGEIREIEPRVKPKELETFQALEKKTRAKASELQEAKSVIERDVNRRLEVVAGNFDGKCPIMGKACPAQDEVESTVKKSKKETSALRASLSTARDEYTKASNDHWLVQEQISNYQAAKARLDSLKAEHARLAPVFERAAKAKQSERADLEETRNDLQTAKEEVELLRSQIQRLQAFEKQIANAWVKITTAEDEIEVLEKKCATYREALVILGPSGAQRRIAETSLLIIEQGANKLLSMSDIPLTVNMQWSREGGDPARTCATCGWPFPKTSKIKECSKCGSARGKNIINKLEVLLSNWSGAAEDLSGASIQLSASSWLRRRRGSAWSVAMIDEPFGALDAAKCVSFANHLASMLRSQYGFEQAFIIAHHSNVLDALPGRIFITGDGECSTAKVLS